MPGGRYLPPEREAEILEAVRTGDDAGLPRYQIAEQVGLSASSLSHFLRVRGLTNSADKDGQALARGCLRWVEVNSRAGATIEKLAEYLGCGADHLRRVAAGGRLASQRLADRMRRRLYPLNPPPRAERPYSLAVQSQMRRQKEAEARNKEYSKALEDGVTPADVADRRYHG